MASMEQHSKATNDSQLETSIRTCKIDEAQRCQSEPPLSNCKPQISHLRKLVDGGTESGSSADFIFDENYHGKSSSEDISLSSGYNSRFSSYEQEIAELKETLKSERELSCEMSVELNKLLEDRKRMKAALSTSEKERHISQLRIQELQQRVEILERAERTRADLNPKRIEDSRTSEGLKKLGLTEDILLALPFGYTTKIRSGFEKLSYENEKLHDKMKKLEDANAKAILENEQLVQKLFSEKRATTEKLEEACNKVKAQEEVIKSLREMLSLLGKDLEQLRSDEMSPSSFSKVLENCRQILPSINSMLYCSKSEAEHDQPRTDQSSDPKPDHANSNYEKLKFNCDLLSQINTNVLVINSQARPPTAPVPIITSSSPQLQRLHWNQRDTTLGLGGTTPPNPEVNPYFVENQQFYNLLK